MPRIASSQYLAAAMLCCAAPQSLAMACPIDTSFATEPPRVVVADAQTGALGSFAARVDAAGRPWIAAVGDGLFPGGSTSQLVIARLGSDGRRDAGFGNGGVRIVQPAAASGAFGGTLAIAPNGDAVVAWNLLEGGQGTILLARVTPDGALRSSFGSGGIARLACATAGQGQRFASGIVVDAFERALVVLSDAGPTGARAYVARIGPDGLPDAAFGSAGCVDFAAATAGVLAGTPGGIAVHGSGRTVVAVQGAGTTRLAMLDDTGALEPGFGVGGVAQTMLGSAISTARIAAAPGQRIVVAQTTLDFDGMTQRAAWEVAALTATGTPDPAFDGEGTMRFVLSTDEAFNDSLRDIAVSPTGDLALLGQAGGQMAILRVRDDGTPDSRDCDAFATFEAGLGAGVRGVAVGGALRDGRVIVLGHAGTAAGSSLGDLVALAVRPGLMFVDGFEPAFP